MYWPLNFMALQRLCQASYQDWMVVVKTTSSLRIQLCIAWFLTVHCPCSGWDLGGQRPTKHRQCICAEICYFLETFWSQLSVLSVFRFARNIGFESPNLSRFFGFFQNLFCLNWKIIFLFLCVNHWCVVDTIFLSENKHGRSIIRSIVECCM